MNVGKRAEDESTWGEERVEKGERDVRRSNVNGEGGKRGKIVWRRKEEIRKGSVSEGRMGVFFFYQCME